MPEMTGGEALVKTLHREGVRVVFGLPGVQLYGAMAALRDEPGVRFFTTRHEQATAYMADGFARAGGEGGFGTSLVVPGPGLLNASAAMSTAYSASSPVLVVSGQIPRDKIGKNVGVLHEVNDQLDAIAPVTKWRRRVLRVSEIPPAAHEAVYQLKTGRPRPVEIEIPPETLEEYGEAELVEPANPVRPAADGNAIDRAVDMLAKAERPVIYAGGGVGLAHAEEPLSRLAEHLQAPVVHSHEGKGAVTDHSYLSLGAALYRGSRATEYAQSADVVLAVGSRLAMAPFTQDQQIIQLDIDGDEIGRNYPHTFGLEGDAGSTLRSLAEGVAAASAPRPSRRDELEAIREATRADGLKTSPQGEILDSLRRGCPEDTIIIAGMTQIGYYSRTFWPAYRPRSFFTSSYSGNLGYAHPFGLGVKVARPEVPVVVISGDGGFLYNSQELATAAQYGINVVVVVFNDNAYGNVSRDMDTVWGGTYGAELQNPDFMALAKAYGVEGIRVDDPLETGRAVANATQLDRPVVVEVPVGRMPRPAFFPQRAPRPQPSRR